MPERLPVVTARDLVRVLERDGWVERRQVGSHKQFTHPVKLGGVTVAMHARRAIPRKVLRNVLRQAGLTTDDLRRLL
jgi:predicted RNA binding protein YcfA (HicA-like mRNA interferase family)